MRITVIALVLLLANNVFAQRASVRGRAILSLPLEYSFPSGIVVVADINPSDLVWIVMSDRDNNPTFQDQDLRARFKAINFLENFYVIEETRDAIHIVKYDPNLVAPGTRRRGLQERIKEDVNDQQIDYGWVAKNKMLLWPNALVNTRNNFTIKALPIFRNIRNIQDIGPLQNGIRIYNSPAGGEQANMSRVNMFQFLYIYKREGSQVLLGKSNVIYIRNPQYSILGWVDTTIIQEWDNQICLEPNFDGQAVAEQNQLQIRPTLLRREEDVSAWTNGGSDNGSTVWSSVPTTARWNTSQKRLPILEYNETSGVVKTGVATNIVDRSGQVIQTVSDNARTVEAYNDTREDMRKINLVFVVDGSQSMRAYNANIRSAIQKIATNREGSRNTVRYAAVVYREAADENCPNGDLSVSAMEGLNQRADPVLEFLLRQSTQESCRTSSSNYRVLYRGISRALRLLPQGGALEGNYIIVIGGAADQGSGPLETALIDQLARLNVNLLAFQMINARDEAFLNFGATMAYLIEHANLKILEHMGRAFRQAGYAASNFVTPIDASAAVNKYYLDYPKRAMRQGWVLFPARGQSLEASSIVGILETMMNNTEQVIEQNISQLEASITGTEVNVTAEDRSNGNGPQISPEVALYARAIGEKLNLPSDVMLKYLDGGYQLFIPGYTVLQTDRLKNALFKRVIFASSAEYDALTTRFQMLTAAGATNTQQRTHMYNAIFQLLVTYRGMNEAQRAMTEMSPDDLQDLITGLHSRNPVLNRFRLSDIQNNKIVSTADISEMVNHFDRIYRFLRTIRSDQTYEFKFNDDTFYWIPEDSFMQ